MRHDGGNFKNKSTEGNARAHGDYNQKELNDPPAFLISHSVTYDGTSKSNSASVLCTCLCRGMLYPSVFTSI